MKNRPAGFLSEKNIEHKNGNNEIFDYIKELHTYLWRFTRAVLPFAGGKLNDYVDVAIEKLEYENKIKEE